MTFYKRLVEEWAGWRIAKYDDNRLIGFLSQVYYPIEQQAQKPFKSIELPEHPDGSVHKSLRKKEFDLLGSI